MPEAGYKKRRAKWTRDEALRVGREWIDRHDGQIPSATDFNPSDLRRAARGHTGKAASWLSRARHFDEHEYPWTGTIAKIFGSWNNYIKEMGRTPRPAHGGGRQSPPADFDTLQYLLDQAKTAEGELRQETLYTLAEQALGLADVEH